MDDVLQLTARNTDTTLTITVTGDLDFATAPNLLTYHDSVLTQLARHPTGNEGGGRDGKRPVERLVLDTGNITFIDAYGLGVLITCRNRARDHRLPLHLTAVPACLHRLLTITGLHHLTTDPNPDQGFSAGPSPR
ncbi:STAS domain-containing protein [Spirillospora sp. CA-253888]